jgi:hypothetical protein
MLSIASAMLKHFRHRAARLFKSIAENWLSKAFSELIGSESCLTVRVGQ